MDNIERNRNLTPSFKHTHRNNMDTTTVLEIIKMIDTQIESNYDDEFRFTWHKNEHCNGYQEGLEALKNHLQNYIDAELSAFESTLGQAE